MRRELDTFKLETLYFEEDMISRFDIIKITEKEVMKKIIISEKYYEQLFFGTDILNIKPIGYPSKLRSGKTSHAIIQTLVVNLD